MKKISIMFFLTLALAVQPAYAMRCGRLLVSEGDSRGEVRAKCGDPTELEEWVEYRVVSGSYYPGYPQVYRNRPPPESLPKEVYIPVRVEQWLYNFGSHRLMQLLRFENGRLVDIDSLNYGYTPERSSEDDPQLPRAPYYDY